MALALWLAASKAAFGRSAWAELAHHILRRTSSFLLLSFIDFYSHRLLLAQPCLFPELCGHK